MRLPVRAAALPALALLAALAATPRSVVAQSGIDLAWNDCRASAASQAAFAGACINTNREELVAALRLDTPVDSVVAVEVVIDVQTEAAASPAWWDYAPGGCRYGMLLASANFLGRTGCLDFWGGEATFDGPPVYVTSAPGGAPNTARIVASFAVLSSHARSLAAATPYYAVRLTIQNDPLSCIGCDVPACLLLQSVRLVRVAGPDHVLDVASAPGAHRVTWQSAACVVVPARRATWGALKSLYR